MESVGLTRGVSFFICRSPLDVVPVDDGVSSHATIRETYDLVNETRQELNERIENLGQKFDFFVTSNEHRLTILETHQSSQADQIVQMSSRLDDHGRMIGVLKDKQREEEATTEAIEEQTKSLWSSRSTLITVTASVLLATVSILSLFHVRF